MAQSEKSRAVILNRFRRGLMLEELGMTFLHSASHEMFKEMEENIEGSFLEIRTCEVS